MLFRYSMQTSSPLPRLRFENHNLCAIFIAPSSSSSANTYSSTKILCKLLSHGRRCSCRCRQKRPSRRRSNRCPTPYGTRHTNRTHRRHSNLTSAYRHVRNEPINSCHSDSTTGENEQSKATSTHQTHIPPPFSNLHPHHQTPKYIIEFLKNNNRGGNSSSE